MLTDQDIDKLTSVLASKTDVTELKDDVESLRESLQGMIVATDGLTKVISDLHMEYVAIGHQVSRHESIIQKLVEKVGLSTT